MSTPEGKIKARVKDVLNRHAGLHYDMPVPGGYGKVTLDFVGCYYGFYFAIETKAGLAGPTVRQEIVMDKIMNAGGMAFLVNDDPMTMMAVDRWLMKVEQHVRLARTQSLSGAVQP